MSTSFDHAHEHRSPIMIAGDRLSDLGGGALDGMAVIGDMALFVWRTLRWMVKRLPKIGRAHV